jgi:predicted  nucleic acid-binding Zn-ribbon protein
MASMTMEINLAKALKVKNRLAGRIAKLDADIKAYNSVPEGKEQLDVKNLIAIRDELVRRLIDLKVAINATNQPVQRLIYELAEFKAKAELFSKLNTQHGTVVEGFSGTSVNYIAQFRKETVDREVRLLEREIDRIQDRLDSFNHETTITIDSTLVDEEAT